MSDITRPPEVDEDEAQAIAKLYGAGRKPTTIALTFRRKSENSTGLERSKRRLPKLQLHTPKTNTNKAGCVDGVVDTNGNGCCHEQSPEFLTSPLRGANARVLTSSGQKCTGSTWGSRKFIDGETDDSGLRLATSRSLHTIPSSSIDDRLPESCALPAGSRCMQCQQREATAKGTKGLGNPSAAAVSKNKLSDCASQVLGHGAASVKVHINGTECKVNVIPVIEMLKQKKIHWMCPWHARRASLFGLGLCTVVYKGVYASSFKADPIVLKTYYVQSNAGST
jgi:hypothetical protein